MLIGFTMMLIAVVSYGMFGLGSFYGSMETYRDTAPVFTVECRYENNGTLIGVYENVSLYHLPDECYVPVYENGRLKETYSDVTLIPTKLSIDKTNSSWDWEEEILAHYESDGHYGIVGSKLGKWYVDGVFEYEDSENIGNIYMYISVILWMVGVLGMIIVVIKERKDRMKK